MPSQLPTFYSLLDWLG